jgi:hypothetical protein
MKSFLRFSSNVVRVMGITFEGSIRHFLKEENLSEISRVIITESPNKSEMKSLIGVLGNQPQIKNLSLSKVKNLSDASHEELAAGLKDLRSLTSLSMDGTNLSSRTESETAGLLLVIQEIGKNPSLRHFTATNHPPLNAVIKYNPLSEISVKTIGQAAAASSSIISMNLNAFWLTSNQQPQFLKILQTRKGPCPEIQFDNLKVGADNLQTLLLADQKSESNMGEIRTLSASMRQISFRN